MGDFVCAVRGGPGSYETRLAALRRAHETGATAHFLSVIDPAAFRPLHQGEQRAIRSELAWRDLAINRATAARAGLGNASFTVDVRDGELVETIAGFARERTVEAILVGTPRRAADAVVGADLQEFAARLQAAAGVPVVRGADS